LEYDAIVIGGGPSGSTVASRLSQKGRRVLVLEREVFPRFHIGESLLPCSTPLFDELGVTSELERRFLRKNAAEFVTGDGMLRRRYPFNEGVVGLEDHAFEVDRAEFDAVLLDNARRLGAEVLEGTEVKAFSFDAGGVRVEAKRDGRELTFTAKVLLDASGQRALVASRLGLRQMDPELKNAAVFSHFEGAERESGDREGDIAIVLVPEGWWWVIPLKGDRTSVGLVLPARALRGQKLNEAFLARQIAETPYLAERLRSARRVEPVRTASDYSYSCSALTGDRWLSVGDAGSFIDPVFSTGVYLGMKSGFAAADAVELALATGRFTRALFIDYERGMRRSWAAYKDFVKGFYLPEFAEVMMHPSDTLQLRQAVTSLLAGHVDRFPVIWRIWIFRAITRANRRLNLTPRLPGRREAAEALR